jgi:hypothetical protein
MNLSTLTLDGLGWDRIIFSHQASFNSLFHEWKFSFGWFSSKVAATMRSACSSSNPLPRFTRNVAIKVLFFTGRFFQIIGRNWQFSMSVTSTPYFDQRGFT